jgi:PAS domain S-box-containing protein
MPDELLDDLAGALERVGVPSYVIDAAGVIRWVNEAGRRVVGDATGRQFTSLVVDEETRHAREMFARKVAGTAKVTDFESVVLRPGGERVNVTISSVPLYNGDRVVGVFGQVARLDEDVEPRPDLHLTPRQTEILRLLERGRSTEEIAEELHLSRETVRNHVRRLLRSLGVRSRLEAVAVAHGDTIDSRPPQLRPIFGV